MLRSMFAAISGLRAHNTMLDVTANDIANVNTIGFKAGRTSFQDILTQSVRGATAPSDALGSINPAQVGLGVIVGGIDVLQTQGNLQSTNKATDLAIQGDGFFILKNGQRSLYTRDGAFDISLDGALVSPSTGMRVQGWMADSAGNIDTNGPMGAIIIPSSSRTPAVATDEVTMKGNLDAGAAVGDKVTTSMSIYDSLGVRHTIRLTYQKNAANQWGWTAEADPSDTTVASLSQNPAPGTLGFLGSGAFDPANAAASISLTYNNGANAGTVGVDMTAMTQANGTSGVAGLNNGFSSGDLITFTVGEGGELTGIFSNGQSQRIRQIALASFVNPGGLGRAGANCFETTAASGEAISGTPGTGGRGRVTTGALEMSNVDLATEFTRLIAAQRGFQASARVITTADEVLQELNGLKR